jgi:hypothetical protein
VYSELTKLLQYNRCSHRSFLFSADTQCYTISATQIWPKALIFELSSSLSPQSLFQLLFTWNHIMFSQIHTSFGRGSQQSFHTKLNLLYSCELILDQLKSCYIGRGFRNSHNAICTSWCGTCTHFKCCSHTFWLHRQVSCYTRLSRKATALLS